MFLYFHRPRTICSCLIAVQCKGHARILILLLLLAYLRSVPVLGHRNLSPVDIILELIGERSVVIAADVQLAGDAVRDGLTHQIGIAVSFAVKFRQHDFACAILTEQSI